MILRSFKLSVIIVLPFLIIKSFSLTENLGQHAKENLYTIKQAQQCFHSKGLVSCQNVINQCLGNQKCQKQLQLFQDCTFQAQNNDQIFNGNCFKNWKQKAIDSKNLIQCLDLQCNFAKYNSEVSLPVLYSCATQALISEPIDCDQECQQILSEKISKEITSKPIKQIYSQDFLNLSQINNESVLKIVELIRKECVDQNGTIRKRHENDLFNKKMSKLKLQAQINKKTITDQKIQNVNSNADELNEEQNSEL